MSLGPLQVIKQTSRCQGAVVFLHGSGDSGQGALDWIKFLIGDVSLPHVKFYFPTAPVRNYTPNGGAPSNVWFDRYDIRQDVPEHHETINSIGGEISGLLGKICKDDGISLSKIVVGGFSMGGALALHMGYRFSPGLAGVFTLSSFLNHNSTIYKEAVALNTPLFMCHGDRDDLVPIEWGRKTYDELTKLGVVNAEFHVIKNAMHELKKNEVLNLYEWIQKVLPDKERLEEQK